MSSKVSSIGHHRCDHSELLFTSTTHAASVGYSRPTLRQRAAATTSAGTKMATAGNNENPAAFPGPLLLPGDDLALYPKYPPQSRRAWIREKARNKVTRQRRTIYIAAPPEVDPKIGMIQKWGEPRLPQKDRAVAGKPKTKDVINYISAFYHDLPVRSLSENLRFVEWDDDAAQPKPAKRKRKAKATDTRHIGLATSTECIGIRARPTPSGDFSHQLNLNDILDAAISMLPDDAYALMLLVEQDLYEDDDDLFVCGRAYGGSRVAVISMARYRPNLDSRQQVEREHAWPASHCKAYLGVGFKEKTSTNIKSSTKLHSQGSVDSPISVSSSDEDQDTDSSSPLRAAVLAHKSLPSLELDPSPSSLSGLWLGRLCRTVSHELGHCFGMDHCVYYACVMQGSASIIEDARQPPYLCPVDLSKLLEATGTTEKGHYAALLKYCDQHIDTHLFAAYGTWIKALFENPESK